MKSNRQRVVNEAENWAPTARISKSDEAYAKPEDEPVALPLFLKSQPAWVQYRDNYYYSVVHHMAAGPEKCIRFFVCMSSMTEARIKERGLFDD